MLQEQKCYIWGTPAEVDSNISDGVYTVVSPRAGGNYVLDRSAKSLMSSLTNKEKLVFTTWLVNERRQGVEWPTIDGAKLKAIIQAPQKSAIKKIELLVLWCLENSDRLGAPINLRESTMYPSMDSVNDFYRLCAYAELCDSSEAFSASKLAEQAGYLKTYIGSEPGANILQMTLSVKGWELAERLQATQSNSIQVFVAMWFNPETVDAYDNGIAAGILDAGYKPVRIDRVEHNNKIDDEIISEIRRSKFLVADFTSQVIRKTNCSEINSDTAIARGGVYFEAGLAKGLGKEVIWTVREDVLPFVHFDTRQFAHIPWKDAADLRQQLSRRISATLGDGPNKKIV